MVETAESLVDRDGWRRLTMTALAGKLGVRGPSLYSHVEGIEALLADVQARAHAELAERLQRAAMGKVGPGAFRALAEVLAAFATEHPGLYELAMSEAIDPGGVTAASEPSGAAVRAVVESFGVAATPDMLMSCLAALHGVLALDRGGLFGNAADTGVVYERAVGMVVTMLEQAGAG